MRRPVFVLEFRLIEEPRFIRFFKSLQKRIGSENHILPKEKQRLCALRLAACSITSAIFDSRHEMNKKATPLERKQLEQLIFGESQVRRFTQDSPILPDVWIEFGRRRGERVDLLLNPYRDVAPGELFKALKARLKAA